MPLKLNFKSSGGAQSSPAEQPLQTPTQEPTSVSTSGPKISFKNKSAATPTTEQPALPSATPSTSATATTTVEPSAEKKKPGRKPKPKNDLDGETPVKQKPGRKRKAADDGNADTPSAKKAKSGGVMLNLKVNTSQLAKSHASRSAGGSFSKIKFKSAKPESQGLSKFRIKHVGTVPQRPVGVGYDSEDEDAEEDPAIEHLLLLRVPPGDDCQYLARMIEEKKIGVKPSDGGADITFQWLDKEGRRSLWNIRGNKYAGALFDLPTITEVFKTWNKKDIMKVTDISQILVILGSVDNEQQAKDYPLPPEVDRERWEYPHGLTPPMRYVRKRRFRKRINYRDIDTIEAQVQKLLEDDKKCFESGGDVTFEYVDPDAPEEHEQADLEGIEDDDAEGEEYDEDADGDGEDLFDEEDMMDEDAMAAELMENFAAGGDEDEEMEVAGAAPTIETAASHALAQAQGVSSAAETPSASAGETTDAGEDADADDGDDDEDDEGDEEDLDDEAIAARQELEQQKEEYEQLMQSLEEAKKTLASTSNALLKTRNQKRVDQLQNEVDLKRAALGIEDDA